MKHLFIDDAFIAEYHGTQIEVNTPAKLGPIVDAGQENIYCRGPYGTIIQSESLAELWGSYRIRGQKDPLIQYSFSADGITWVNPNINQFRDVRKTPNNIVLKATQEGSVFFDPNDMRFPYKYMYFTRDHGPEGLFLIRSPNGKDWIGPPEKLQHVERASQNVVFWDERLNKYVAYVRGWKQPNMAQDRDENRLRVVERWEFDSFEELKYRENSTGGIPHVLSGARTVIEPDEYDMPDSDIYTNAVVQYLQDVYFAFPSLYRHMQIGSGYDFRQLPNEGILEIQIATSRDGITWNRYRKPYVPMGIYGEHDTAQMYMFTGMLVFDTYCLQYYSGTDYTHRESPVFSRRKERNMMVNVVKQRKDGFVGFVNFDPMTVAKIRTEPFEFSGYISLNFDAGASGYVRCSLRDGAQKIATQKVSFVGNWLEKRVEFDNPEVREYRGKQLALEIEFKNAKVFGFTY